VETTGRIKGVAKDWQSDKLIISFEVNGVPSDLHDLEDKPLNITAKPYRRKRSKDANAMLWACLGEIAAALRTDKWEVYLQMLKRYGAYTYVLCKPQAVDMLKRQWRECEEVGTIIDVNGKPAVQMLCYYGSSTYDTKQFSVLLDGVVSEMKEMGLETPPSEDLRRSLEAWEKLHGQRETD